MKAIPLTPSISLDFVDLLLDSFNSQVENVIDDIAPIKISKKNGRQKSSWRKSTAVQCRGSVSVWQRMAVAVGVNSFKFLCVHITEDLTWSAHTDAVLKKAHQRLFFLRWLRKFGTSPSILRSFYTCTVESILTGYITAWFGNSTAGNHKALQRVVRTARHIVGGELPSLQDIYTRKCIRKARRITPATRPTICSLCCPQEDVSAASDPALTDWGIAFSPQAIRLMNSKN